MLTKKLDSFIFLLGVFLIPFDNLVIAPSAGWATLAPFVFLTYILFNIKYLKIKKDCVIVGVVIAIFSLFNYLVFTPYISNILNGLGTLLLGLTFYYSLNVFFIVKKNNPRFFLNILFIAYFISFVYGLLQLLNFGFLNQIFVLIEKRHYFRLSFSFTEPSFISLHIFGVLLPIIIIFKDYKKEGKKLFALMICFLVVTLIKGQSGRCFIDVAIVFLLYILTDYFKNGFTTNKLFLIPLIPICFIVGYLVLINNNRVGNIMEKGIYFDSSLSARWFRIVAITKGLIKNPQQLLFGYGLGNTFYPFNNGYDYALSVYKNAYMGEVLSLYNTHDSQFFCGHLRIIADFGLFIYIYILWLLIKNKKTNLFLLLVILYLYIQFDSFAWYSIWLYLFYTNYSKLKKSRIL